MQVTGLRRIATICLACLLPAAGAADFSFSGRFIRDDNRSVFTFTLASAGTVTLRTLSYGGGAAANGAPVAPGGFDPSLFLFDNTGLLIAANGDGGCGAVSADPVTGQCWDAYLRLPLPAGTYQVVLAEYDNAPFGPSLAEPFLRDGAGNFTAALAGMPSAAFWDQVPARRTDAYALDILGADTALEAEAVAVVNSATLERGDVAPNTVLSLYGTDLACASGLRVLVGGSVAEVLYAGPTQITLVTPASLAGILPAAVQLECDGREVGRDYVNVTGAAPALFTVAQSGAGQASILNQNGMPNWMEPAARGSQVQVFGTGFGTVGPAGADGLVWLEAPVTAVIGGQTAEVEYAGLAPGMTAGLQQITVRIPPQSPTGPAVPIQILAAGHATQLAATLAVRP